MASGVEVSDECMEAFEALKMGKKFKYVVFKITDDHTQIVVDDAASEGDWDAFLAKLPKDDGRYALFDFDYTLNDGGQRNKILFIQWAPDAAKIKKKMLYASSVDAFKKQLPGVTVFHASELDELEKDEIRDKISAGGTK
eukprot:m.134347 g.134347  ORF g.134347 m.134347 type:complete len:140 (-) comp9559_c0_seq1:110-529(-)